MIRLFYLTLTLTFANLLISQDLRVDETDEFTGTVKKITENYVLAKGVGTMKGAVGHIDDLYALYTYSTADLGCAGASGNYVIFLFEDKTTYKVDVDHADIDCSDYSTSIFILDPKEFQSKTLTKIRFSQGDAYDDCTIASANPKYTMAELIKAVE